MTISIKAANGDIFWFDAVTDYSINLSSQLTSHPIETRKQVSDHVVRNNPKIRISGLFSDYDPNTDRSIFSLIVNQTDEVRSSRIVNNIPQLEATVRSRGVGDQSLVGFDYDIVENALPIVTTEFIKKRLTEIQRNGETCTVIEFDGNVIKANGFFQNAVIVGLDYVENADSGDALYVQMDFEIATFVDLKKVNLPAGLRAGTQNKKPSVTTTEVSETAPSKGVIRNAPTKNSGALGITGG